MSANERPLRAASCDLWLFVIVARIRSAKSEINHEITLSVTKQICDSFDLGESVDPICSCEGAVANVVAVQAQLL
jgi:hypothetical protein